MMRSATLFFFLTLLVHISCAQQRVYDHTISFQSDNDNYAAHYKDGYYTNGLFIRYTYLPKRFKFSADADKVISWYSAGQQIYTSESIHDEFLFMIDRPFSAYLFLQKGFQLFYKNGRALKVSLSAGLTGRGAGGEEVQNKYHDLLKLIHTRGWMYQLNTGPALNAEAEGFGLAGKQNKQHPALHYNYQVRAGTAFCDLTAGMLIRLGKKQPLISSCFTEGNNGEVVPRRELFFYFWPRVRYQFYNATVQGNVFNKDKGPLTATVQHGQWLAEGGFCVAGKQQSVRISITAQAREAKTMRHDMLFGSVLYSHFLHIKRPGSAHTGAFGE